MECRDPSPGSWWKSICSILSLGRSSTNVQAAAQSACPATVVADQSLTGTTRNAHSQAHVDPSLRRSPRLSRRERECVSDSLSQVESSRRDGVAAAKQPRYLRRDLARIWAFLRERRWKFVDSNGWMVIAPSSRSWHANPMRLSQVTEYVDNNPRLRRDYRRWVGELFVRDAENDASSDGDDSDYDVGRTRTNYGGPRAPTSMGGSGPTRGRRKSRRYRRSAVTEARAPAANRLPARVPSRGRGGKPSRPVDRDGRPGVTRAGLRHRTRASRTTEGSSKTRTRCESFDQPRSVGNGRYVSDPAQAATVTSVTGDTVPMNTPGSWEERLSVYQRSCRARSASGRESPADTDASSGEARNGVPSSGDGANSPTSAAGVGTGVIGTGCMPRRVTERKGGVEDVSWLRLGQRSEYDERESATRRKLSQKLGMRGTQDLPEETCAANLSGAPVADGLSAATLPWVGVRNEEASQDRTQGAWKRTRSSRGKRRSYPCSSVLEAMARADPSGDKRVIGRRGGTIAAEITTGQAVPAELPKRKMNAKAALDDDLTRLLTPHACKKQRIDVDERDRNTRCSGAGRTASSIAPSSGSCGGMKPTVLDGGDDPDPLAPYLRIERETVNDEGLEDLLHNSQKSGYLDLRKHVKAGLARPVRATILGVNHGGSFLKHLKALLREGRRVEATVFLRKLQHFDRMPPQLTAAAGKGLPCLPAWYQRVQALQVDSAGPSVREVVDLTAKEVEVIECDDDDDDDGGGGGGMYSDGRTARCRKRQRRLPTSLRGDGARAATSAAPGPGNRGVGDAEGLGRGGTADGGRTSRFGGVHVKVEAR